MFSANKMLSIGIPEIDADHEALNGLAYKIEKAVISGTPLTEIRILAAELQSTAQSHFDKEERILAPYNLPRMAEHKVMHKKTIDDLSALSEAMEDDNSNWRDHLFSIIGDLTQHVILYDMEARGEPVPDLSENSIFESVRQGKIEDALQLWKSGQERKGICDLAICENLAHNFICCAHHLQGHTLSLSLANPDGDYFKLSRKIGEWIESHNSGDAEPGNGTAKKLIIPSSLVIGHPTIDYDHGLLVGIINNISEALDNEEYKKCSRLTDKFINLAKAHFKREEQILEETGFPELASHKNTHKELTGMLSRFDETSQELKENKLARARLYPELVAFLFDDAVKADLSFKSYLMKLGLAFD